MSTRAKIGCIAALLTAAPLVTAHAQSQNATVSLGMKRAAASRIDWEAADATHPILGNVRSAQNKAPLQTQVSNYKVYSRVQVSCQKNMRKMAIELSNASEPGVKGGLKPNKDPELFCSRPLTSFDEKVVTEPLLSNWQMNEMGEAISIGFRPFPLHECVAIKVSQEVALPPGWSQKSAKVEFEITPYNRELDSVFATCGEETAYPDASTATKVAAAAAPLPPASPKPASAAPANPPAADAWRSARVITTGKTNVRSSPNVNASVVVQLDPGSPVLVQKTGNEWWKAKAAKGTPFEGFIRQDRLMFR